MMRFLDTSGRSVSTDGFWWANLTFEAAPDLPDLALPPVTVGGVTTYYCGTVRILAPDRTGDFWVVPGMAVTPIIDVDAWRIKIDGPFDFCHNTDYAQLWLIDDSLVEGVVQWLNLPPGVEYIGNPYAEIDPGTVPPGHYTVLAQSFENPLVFDETNVDILHLDVSEPIVWLSASDTNAYTIALSSDTYPSGGSVTVTSQPAGIHSRTFTPSTLTNSTYTVHLTRTCGNAQITVNIVRMELVPVLADTNGVPRVSGRLPVLGDPLDVMQEGFSTYCPDPGTNRGPVTIETDANPNIWTQLTEQSDGSSAVLMMTHPTEERFSQWSLYRDYSSELVVRYCTDIGASNNVATERSLSYDTNGFYGLTIYMNDESYTRTTNSYIMPFQAFSPSGDYTYSNYRLTGPPVNAGFPPYSDRNLFVFRVQGVDPSATNNVVFTVDVEDDYGTQTLSFTNVIDGKLCTDVMVPVLNVDAGRDLGLEGMGVPINTHIVKFAGNGSSTVSSLRYGLNSIVSGSGRRIANGSVPVKKAWLLTALYSNEENGEARANLLAQGGETIISYLGYEATMSVTPTKAQILDLLPRHRHWIHSGHGNYDLGITTISPTGNNHFKEAVFSTNDMAGIDLTYDLVFMNTCQSTDTYYAWIWDIPNILGHYATTPVSLPVHKVYDIGLALHARNYVGWDSDAVRLVAINASKNFPVFLNGGNTVSRAVELTKAAIAIHNGVYTDANDKLRAVVSDGSKFDLKK